jgi:hypothetical protein
MQGDILTTDLNIERLKKRKFVKLEGFGVNPRVRMSDVMKNRIKKHRIDGPYTVYQSDFMMGLEETVGEL